MLNGSKLLFISLPPLLLLYQLWLLRAAHQQLSDIIRGGCSPGGGGLKGVGQAGFISFYSMLFWEEWGGAQ